MYFRVAYIDEVDANVYLISCHMTASGALSHSKFESLDSREDLLPRMLH